MMTVWAIQQPHLKPNDKKQILERITQGKLNVDFKESPKFKPKPKEEEPLSA